MLGQVVQCNQRHPRMKLAFLVSTLLDPVLPYINSQRFKIKMVLIHKRKTKGEKLKSFLPLYYLKKMQKSSCIHMYVHNYVGSHVSVSNTQQAPNLNGNAYGSNHLHLLVLFFACLTLLREQQFIFEHSSGIGYRKINQTEAGKN